MLDDFIASKSPVLDTSKSTFLRLSLAQTEVLSIPLLSTLNTIPARRVSEGEEELGIELLVLL